MELFACLLPFLVGCGWFAFLSSKRNKTLAMKALAITSLLGGTYFLCDALVVFGGIDFDKETIVYAGTINTLIGPMFSLTAIVVIIALIKTEQHASTNWLLVLVPYICYSLLVLVVTETLGFEKAADYIANNRMKPGLLLPEEAMLYEFFEVVTNHVYRIVMITNMAALLLLICYALYVSDFKPKVIFNFLFKGGPIRPLHLLSLFVICLLFMSHFRFFYNRSWWSQHTDFLYLTYTVKGLLFCMIGLFGVNLQKPAVYLVNQHKTPHFEDLPVLSPRVKWREESNEDEYQLPMLLNSFYNLMRDQQCYRRPGLNIYSVSSELGVTANSLNHMLKAVYGVNYNTYIKVQRVAFARHLHKAHPELSAEEVAMESGFRSKEMMKQHFKEAAYVVQTTVA